MPITSLHPVYETNLAIWQRCRSSFEGEDAIKSAGKQYLPQPGGFDKDEYEHYVHRALYYEAVARSINGFVGAVARKDPTINVPTALECIVEDATADGLSLDELIKRLCSEAILQGRVGVLVDYDDVTARCYLAPYMVESITNWDDDQVILNETVYEADPEDRFKMLAIEQYRQLWMNEGVYTVTVWRKLKTEDNRAADWAIYSEAVPKRVGKPLDAMPFFWLTPMGKTSKVERPPLLGLINVCLAHYRNSADLEWGLHFTGLPTLYVTGTNGDDAPISVGSTAAIMLHDPAAKVGYAEFTGQGLGALENALAAKERMMAVLGASVFSQEKNGVEAEGTARIRTSGETNLLSGVVTSVEETVQAALECAAEWMGITNEKIEVTLSRDFIETKIDGPTLTGLVQAYQSGALSLPQFLYNMEQGEMLSPETDLEEEAALVEAAIQKKADDATKQALAVKPITKGVA